MIAMPLPAPIYLPKREIIKPPGLICPPRYRAPCKRATMIQPMRRGQAPAGGGNIQFVGGKTFGDLTGTSDQSVSLTDLSGGLDTAPATDDIVIVAEAVGNNGSNNPDTLIAVGYTGIGTDLLEGDDSWDALLGVGYKFMGVTPDTSVTCRDSGHNQNGGAVSILVFRGVDQSVPLDGVTPTEATGSNGCLVNPPSISPADTNGVVVSAGAGVHAGATGEYSSSDLSDMNSITGEDSNGFFQSSVVGMAWAAYAATVDPAQWTFSGSSSSNAAWASMTFVLRAA